MTPSAEDTSIRHRHLDGWQGLREGVDSGDGWPLYLRRFGELVTRSG